MTIHILVGNVGCGKSTLAKKLAGETGALVLNKDSIAKMLLAGDYKRYNNLNLKLVFGLNQVLFSVLLQDSDRDIVVDETHMTIKKRKNVLKTISYYSKEHCQIICHDFGEGTKVGLSRRCKENRGVPAKKWCEVFEIFKSQYERPEIEEGFDNIVRERGGKV